jgi:glycosyltransferase involved in cell wall biosynthesis
MRLRTTPLAAGALLRHLARGSAHVDRFPQPWRSPAYDDALASLTAGDLLSAERKAIALGWRGRFLASYVAGELGVLASLPPIPPLSPLSPIPPLSPLSPIPPDVLRSGCANSHLAGRRAGGAGAVLHLVTNALPETVAGYTIRTQGITRAQRSRGRESHVATRLGFPATKGHLSAGERLVVDGVPHHRLLPARLPLRADRALARDVDLTARLVEELRPAVLHAHSNHVNAQVALALRERFGIPVVYEVRGFLEETWRSRSTNPQAGQADSYRLARATETRVMRAADAVVTLSESMRDAIVARGVDPDRVTVVPNCVDDRFLEDGGDLLPPGDSKSPSSLTVGTVGTLNAYEGLDLLVEAVAELRRAGHDVRLRIVGDGPERTALEKQSAELGITDASTFTGRVPHDQVVAEHEQIDVFCVPRLDLPVTRLVPPLKPVEAMALGRPVIASDLPPLRELSGDGRGVLVPPGDVTALAAAIADLSQPDVRRQQGATARAWVEQTRTWTAAAGAYEQIYRHIQGETP